jgi:hypothetical protein
MYFFITHFEYLSLNIKNPEITSVLTPKIFQFQDNLSEKLLILGQCLRLIFFCLDRKGPTSMKKICHNALRSGNEKDHFKKL